MKSTFLLVFVFFILACSDQIHSKEKAVGKTLKGKREGTWKIYYPNGKIKEILDYKGDSLHGNRITYYENGKVFTNAHYNMGIFVDSFFLYYQNGQLQWESWFDSTGKSQGTNKNYYETGELRAIGQTLNDKDEDTTKGFYKNKKIMYFIPYKNGKKQGTALYFDEEGKQTKKEIYKDDSLIKTGR